MAEKSQQKTQERRRKIVPNVNPVKKKSQSQKKLDAIESTKEKVDAEGVAGVKGKTEVFVLSPDMLKKMGINIGALQDAAKIPNNTPQVAPQSQRTNVIVPNKFLTHRKDEKSAQIKQKLNNKIRARAKGENDLPDSDSRPKETVIVSTQRDMSIHKDTNNHNQENKNKAYHKETDSQNSLQTYEKSEEKNANAFCGEFRIPMSPATPKSYKLSSNMETASFLKSSLALSPNEDLSSYIAGYKNIPYLYESALPKDQLNFESSSTTSNVCNPPAQQVNDSIPTFTDKPLTLAEEILQNAGSRNEITPIRDDIILQGNVNNIPLNNLNLENPTVSYDNAIASEIKDIPDSRNIEVFTDFFLNDNITIKENVDITDEKKTSYPCNVNKSLEVGTDVLNNEPDESESPFLNLQGNGSFVQEQAFDTNENNAIADELHNTLSVIDLPMEFIIEKDESDKIDSVAEIAESLIRLNDNITEYQKEEDPSCCINSEGSKLLDNISNIKKLPPFNTVISKASKMNAMTTMTTAPNIPYYFYKDNSEMEKQSSCLLMPHKTAERDQSIDSFNTSDEQYQQDLNSCVEDISKKPENMLSGHQTINETFQSISQESIINSLDKEPMEIIETITENVQSSDVRDDLLSKTEEPCDTLESSNENVNVIMEYLKKYLTKPKKTHTKSSEYESDKDTPEDKCPSQSYNQMEVKVLDKKIMSPKRITILHGVEKPGGLKLNELEFESPKNIKINKCKVTSDLLINNKEHNVDDWNIFDDSSNKFLSDSESLLSEDILNTSVTESTKCKDNSNLSIDISDVSSFLDGDRTIDLPSSCNVTQLSHDIMSIDDESDNILVKSLCEKGKNKSVRTYSRRKHKSGQKIFIQNQSSSYENAAFNESTEPKLSSVDSSQKDSETIGIDDFKNIKTNEYKLELSNDKLCNLKTYEKYNDGSNILINKNSYSDCNKEEFNFMDDGEDNCVSENSYYQDKSKNESKILPRAEKNIVPFKSNFSDFASDTSEDFSLVDDQILERECLPLGVTQSHENVNLADSEREQRFEEFEQQVLDNSKIDEDVEFEITLVDDDGNIIDNNSDLFAHFKSVNCLEENIDKFNTVTEVDNICSSKESFKRDKSKDKDLQLNNVIKKCSNTPQYISETSIPYKQQLLSENAVETLEKLDNSINDVPYVCRQIIDFESNEIVIESKKHSVHTLIIDKSKNETFNGTQGSLPDYSTDESDRDYDDGFEMKTYVSKKGKKKQVYLSECIEKIGVPELTNMEKNKIDNHSFGFEKNIENCEQKKNISISENKSDIHETQILMSDSTSNTFANTHNIDSTEYIPKKRGRKRKTLLSVIDSTPISIALDSTFHSKAQEVTSSEECSNTSEKYSEFPKKTSKTFEELSEPCNKYSKHPEERSELSGGSSKPPVLSEQFCKLSKEVPIRIPKKRGRKRKVPLAGSDENQVIMTLDSALHSSSGQIMPSEEYSKFPTECSTLSEEFSKSCKEISIPIPKKRGRKRKVPISEENENISDVISRDENDKKLKRKINQLEDQIDFRLNSSFPSAIIPNDNSQSTEVIPKIPKKRGRKRKIPLPVDEVQVSTLHSGNEQKIIPSEEFEECSEFSKECAKSPEEYSEKSKDGSKLSDEYLKPFEQCSQPSEKVPKKRGRKKKVPIKSEDECTSDTNSSPGKIKRIRRPNIQLEKPINFRLNPSLKGVIVKCSVCELQMKYVTWKEHNFKCHHSLAWIEGGTPLDLKDDAMVLKILLGVVKKKKKLVCTACGDSRGSALGYMAHLTMCQKTNEEIEALKVACPICSRLILPFSLSVHVRTHKVVKECEEKHESDSEQLENKKRVRKAAQQAHETLRSINAEEDKPIDGDQTYTKSFNSTPSPKLINRWKLVLEKGDIIYCPRHHCEFTGVDLQEMTQHYSQSCSRLPKINFKCICCNFNTGNEQIMVDHVKEYHKPSEIQAVDFPAHDSEAEEHNKYELAVEEEDEDEDEDEEEGEEEVVHNKSRIRNPPINLKSYTSFKFAFPKITKETYMEWRHKFVKETFSTSTLYGDMVYNEYTALSTVDAEPFLPETRTSCNVVHKLYPEYNVLNPHQTEVEWRKYELFESDLYHGSQTFWCGGPVWCLSWLPGSRPTSYLAVAADSRIDYKYPEDKCVSHENLVQIWDVGVLDNRKGECVTAAKLVFSIAHCFGMVWDMTWCPSGCDDDCQQQYSIIDDNDFLRMGLLAVACSDGNAYIFSVCNPALLPPSDSNIYSTEPVAKLQLYSDGSSSLGQKQHQAVKVFWSEEKGHETILVGYSSGLVAFFNIDSKSPLLVCKRGPTIVFSSYYNFQPYTTSITGLVLLPNSLIDNYDGGHGDKVVGVTSLSGYSVWSDGVQLVNKRGRYSSATLSPHFPQILTYSEEYYMAKKALGTSGNLSATCVRSISGHEIVMSCGSAAPGGGGDSCAWTGAVLNVGVPGEVSLQPVLTSLITYLRQKKVNVRKRALLSFPILMSLNSQPTPTNLVAKPKVNSKVKVVNQDRLNLNFVRDASTYEEAVEKYGLMFIDVPWWKKKPMSPKERGSLDMSPDRWPLQSGLCGKIHPEVNRCWFIAHGGRAGFVRVTCARHFTQKPIKDINPNAYF